MEVGFEIPVPKDAQPEHCPAEHERSMQGCSRHVFDNGQSIEPREQRTSLRDQVRVFVAMHRPRPGVRLTRRAGPYEVRSGEVNRWPKRIALNEGERVARLRPDIDADYIEARSVQTHARAASPAEEIDGERPPHARSTS
jgi:hypothetical protein